MCTPFSRATGFSLASASSEVSRRPSSRATWWVVPVGLPVVVDIGRVDRHDLALEAALGPRPLRALLRLEPELVAVGAGDAPLVGDALRALELRRELVVLAVRRRWSGGRSRRAPPRRAGPGSSTRRRTRARRRRRPTSRATPRGWSPVATSRTGCRRCVPATSSGSPALSHAVRAMLNVCSPTWLTQPPMTWPTSAGIDARPLDHGSLHGAEQVDRVHGGQAAVAAPERRADGFDDDDVVVGDRSPRCLLDRSATAKLGADRGPDRTGAGSDPDPGAMMQRVRRQPRSVGCSPRSVLAACSSGGSRDRPASTVDVDRDAADAPSTTAHDRADRPPRPSTSTTLAAVDHDDRVPPTRADPTAPGHARRRRRRRRCSRTVTVSSAGCTDHVIFGFIAQGRRDLRAARVAYEHGAVQPTTRRARRSRSPAPRSSSCAARPPTATTSRSGTHDVHRARSASLRQGRSHVREIVETGDFEGVLTWVIGLDSAAPVPRHRHDGPARRVDRRDHVLVSRRDRLQRQSRMTLPKVASDATRS